MDALEAEVAARLTGDVEQLVGLDEYLRYLPRVRRDEVLEHAEVQYLQATRCTVTGLDGPCGIDVDGDFVGRTPLEVETVAGVVRFLTRA